jgi:hypothetical protein
VTPPIPVPEFALRVLLTAARAQLEIKETLEELAPPRLAMEIEDLKASIEVAEALLKK